MGESGRWKRPVGVKGLIKMESSVQLKKLLNREGGREGGREWDTSLNSDIKNRKKKKKKL